MWIIRYAGMLVLLLSTFVSSAFAAEQPPVPSNTESIPEAPPPPKLEAAPGEQPEVTTVKKGEVTIEEYRIAGQLYMQKITPAKGLPYYLVKDEENGGWSRFDGPSPPLSVPQWIIFRF
jgi:Protein of unknown function (DUF2782)